MMKKIAYSILGLTMAMFIAIGGTQIAFAEKEPPIYVWDFAKLFSAEEVDKLATEMDSLVKKHKLDFRIVTTADNMGKTSAQFADDFYVDNKIGIGKKKSGVLLLINMSDSEVYVSTFAEASEYLTDQRIKEILDDVVGELSEGNYYEAAKIFLSDTSASFEAGIPDNQHLYDKETGKVTKPKKVTAFEFAIASLISIATACSFYFITVRSYRAESLEPTYHFRDSSTLDLSVNTDDFISKTVFSRRVPPPQPPTSSGGNDVSGRTTTHTSSSGNTHGGDGRKF